MITKKRKLINEKIDKEKLYSADEALGLVKEFASAKFEESIDVSINLGVDPKQSDQVVRGSTVLPNGTGKTVRVAVFAQGENAEKAKSMGADIVGFEDLAEEIKSGKMDFEVVIATPDAMRIVGQLGQILGPRGLMPNPKSGTVTMDIGKAIREVKAGKIDFKVDRFGIIHTAVGKVSFTAKQIEENANEVINSVIKLKPSSAKGTYIKSLTMSPTMGPGIAMEVKNA